MGCAGPGERVAERKTSFPKGQPLGLHLPLHCHSSYTYAVPSSLRNLVWSLVLRSQKTRIWELTPPVYRLRSSSISAAALIAWTSFPLQGVVCLVGEAFSHLGTSLSISPLSFPSAFSDPVFEPACLPGLVLSRHLQGSRLWPLDLVVCDLHPLCLPLLVPTRLQGF